MQFFFIISEAGLGCQSTLTAPALAPALGDLNSSSSSLLYNVLRLLLQIVFSNYFDEDLMLLTGTVTFWIFERREDK